MNMAAILFLFIFILLQLFARNRGRDERGTMIMRNNSIDRRLQDGSDLQGHEWGKTEDDSYPQEQGLRSKEQDSPNGNGGCCD